MAHIETPKTDLVFISARGGGFGPDKDLLAWFGPPGASPFWSQQNAVFCWRTDGGMWFATTPPAREAVA